MYVDTWLKSMCLHEFWSLLSSNAHSICNSSTSKTDGGKHRCKWLLKTSSRCVWLYFEYIHQELTTGHVWHFAFFPRWLWACSLCRRHDLIWKIRHLLYAMRHGRAMLDRYIFKYVCMKSFFTCNDIHFALLYTHTLNLWCYGQGWYWAGEK
jgi:hypothetical protein